MMITKENYIEISQVECTECGTALDWNTVDDAIREYGLIVLHRNSDNTGYFGYTCPNCIKTTLHKTDEKFLLFLVSGNLSNPNLEVPHPKGAHLLGYDSNLGDNLLPPECPFMSESIFDNNFMPIAIKHTVRPGNIRIAPRIIDPVPISGDILTDSYCSFISGSSFIGPVPIIQFLSGGLINDEYSDSHLDKNPIVEITGLSFQMQLITSQENIIKKCQKIENSFGNKVFNRYILIDPIYSSMNEFYFKHFRDFHPSTMQAEIITKIRSDKINSSTKPSQEKTNKNVSPANSREILGWQLTDEEEKQFYQYINNDPQLRFMKTTDFLEILCMPSIYDFIQHQIQTHIFETLYPTHDTDTDFTELKLIYSEIWDNFHSKSLQDLLAIMADDFLDSYLELSRRIDCSFEQLWDLRQQYLFDVYEAVKSPRKMRIKKNEAIGKYIEKIQLLEMHFPELQKIKTVNIDLNKLKEKLITIGEANIIDRFLLLGETGTGKELFAKAIHEVNERPGAFIPRNCAAVPNNMFESEFFGHKKGSFTGASDDSIGAFEQADKGTLFLDEIGELDLNNQARLLRVLQEREIKPIGGKVKTIDFYLVSATNRDLRIMIEEGKFREDLYQRISDYVIHIPSLNQRKEDIELLANHFIRKYDRTIITDSSIEPLTFSKDVLKALKNYHWRGNVRELEKVCKKVLGFRKTDDRSEIDISEFNLEDQPTPNSKQKKTASPVSNDLPGNTKITPEQVKQAMANNNNNKTKAAKELGVTYHTVLRHCKNLGI